jgi:hypothetical protein
VYSSSHQSGGNRRCGSSRRGLGGCFKVEVVVLEGRLNEFKGRGGAKLRRKVYCRIVGQ